MAYARRRDEWRAGVVGAVSSLGTWGPPKQPRWPVALQMALALSIPIAVGVVADRVDLGVLASLGAFTVPYFASLPRLERLRLRPLPAVALIVSATAGGLLGPYAHWATVGLVAVTILASYGVFAYRLGPPGPLFPVLVYGIAAGAGSRGVETATLVACVTAGCALAFGISAAPLIRRVHWTIQPRPLRELLARPTWERGDRELMARIAVVAIAGTTVAAITVDPERAYWVVGAGVVVVGFVPGRIPSLHRGVHRTLGTVVGAGVYLALAAMHPGAWALLAVLFALQYFTEILITRHYALAVALLTPLALTLATVASGQFGDVGVAVERALDTAVGAGIAMLTAFIHRPDVDRSPAPTP